MYEHVRHPAAALGLVELSARARDGAACAAAASTAANAFPQDRGFEHQLDARGGQRERSAKIKLKIKKTCFEN